VKRFHFYRAANRHSYPRPLCGCHYYEWSGINKSGQISIDNIELAVKNTAAEAYVSEKLPTASFTEYTETDYVLSNCLNLGKISGTYTFDSA
jgi:hypothetical protein